MFPDTHASSSPPTRRERESEGGREGGKESKPETEEGFEAAARPFSLPVHEGERERGEGG